MVHLHKKLFNEYLLRANRITYLSMTTTISVGRIQAKMGDEDEVEGMNMQFMSDLGNLVNNHILWTQWLY